MGFYPPRLMPEDFIMNSDELKHNEVRETNQNGEHAVSPQAPVSPAVNRLLDYPSQSGALTQVPLSSGESNNEPPTKRPPRRSLIVGAIIALVIIAGLTTPWFGVERSRAVLGWMTSAQPTSTLCGAAAAMVIGGLLVYAYWPRAQAPAK